MPRRRTIRRPNPSAATAATAAIAAAALVIPEPIVVPVEDFGKDKDLKALLKTLQPKPFTGEGTDVPRDLEEWIMSMGDYFDLAGYNDIAQGIMGRAKLAGSAKLWWKLSCQSRCVAEVSQGWETLKYHLRERYLPLTYDTDKMNEFLSCNRKGRAVEAYYEDFVKLSRHAPLMSENQKLSRFILGLDGKLADEVEALRPVSLADALIRAKSKLNSFLKEINQGERKRENQRQPETFYRPQKIQQVVRPIVQPPQPNFQPVRVNALAAQQPGSVPQCHGCNEWGHMRKFCPKLNTNMPPLLPTPSKPVQTPLITNSGRPPLQNEVYPNRNQRNLQGRPRQTHQSSAPPPKTITVNYVSIEEDEVEEQATIYAALETNKPNHQYYILEAQDDYKGRIQGETAVDFGYEEEEVAPSNYLGSLDTVGGQSY